MDLCSCHSAVLGGGNAVRLLRWNGPVRLSGRYINCAVTFADRNWCVNEVDGSPAVTWVRQQSRNRDRTRVRCITAHKAGITNAPSEATLRQTGSVLSGVITPGERSQILPDS